MSDLQDLTKELLKDKEFKKEFEKLNTFPPLIPQSVFSLWEDLLIMSGIMRKTAS